MYYKNLNLKILYKYLHLKGLQWLSINFKFEKFGLSKIN